MPFRYDLNADDISQIRDLTQPLSANYSSVDEEGFLGNVTVYAQELPRNLRTFLNDFRLADQESDYAIVSGFPIDNDKIGPTPPHWDNRPAASTTLREEIYMMMLCSMVGDPFGWATQQGGYVCHDLLPVKGLEMEQTGASSQCLLDWHTEDAFHPCRGDYVALMCLRNPDNTATTVGGLDLDLLSEQEIELLFEPRFSFKPDLTHKADFQGRKEFWHGEEKDRLENCYLAMSKNDKAPPKVPILSGRR